MISIYEKVRIQILQREVTKYLILASMLHIFQNIFLQSLIPISTV